MPKFVVSLTPALARRLSRQAKRHKRCTATELAFIVETWFHQDLEGSVRLGDEIHSALDKAFAKPMKAKRRGAFIRTHVKVSNVRKRPQANEGVL